MNSSYDVVVIGGGIVGMSAAIAMSQRGFSVALMDAGNLAVDINVIDSRVYALNHASKSLLQGLGVWEHLDFSRVSPYTHMHVWDGANGAHIDFDSRMQGTDRLGCIIEESVLKAALLQQLVKESIEQFPHTRVNALQMLPHGINISDGLTNWRTALLMVADGAASKTRELLGVGTTGWSYHQQAIVATIRTEKPHQSTAYQVFNPDGPLAFLPLADPHQCSIVWSTKPSRVEALMRLSNDDFASELKRAFAAKLGDCVVESVRYTFPLHMRHAKQYSGACWLLMGDAAHTIHPLAGLGLNVGLADLSSWLKTLSVNKRNASSPKTLGAYQRERKFEVWKAIALMESLKTVFAQPLPPLVTLRGFGLKACDSLLPLKRWFIRQAAGG